MKERDLSGELIEKGWGYVRIYGVLGHVEELGLGWHGQRMEQGAFVEWKKFLDRLI